LEITKVHDEKIRVRSSCDTLPKPLEHKSQPVVKSQSSLENAGGAVETPSLTELSELGAVADRKGLSKAARNLDKHAIGKRAGSSAFPEPTGGVADKNVFAQTVLDDILTDPTSVMKQRFGKAKRPVLQVFKPDGSGVIFQYQDGHWEFFYFAENLY